MVLGRYLPFKNAGIENYTQTLVEQLLKDKHTVKVAVVESESETAYLYEGVRVIPLKNGFNSFAQLVNEEKFDICHFQEYSGTNGINLAWFRVVKKNCDKVYFTFHLPYLTCYKKDFRYKGIEDCNDFSSPGRCVKCIITTKLKYKKTSDFSIRNFFINQLTPLVEKSPGINRLKERIVQRKFELTELISICDNIFVYADWFKMILSDNGFTSSAIARIPYVTSRYSKSEIPSPDSLAIKNKIVFVGRIEKQKGLLLLCKAMNLLKKNIELDVFGNIVDQSYHRECISEYSYTFKGTLPLKDLLSLLHEYDFLVMPSVFTEMSSMMIKDAFLYRLPVIASSAKGNVDVIAVRKNGFIFEYNDYEDLARVIDEAYDLKQNNWHPLFEETDSYERDLGQILSYY
jgi:glycosyltransferase involved in cell wall biosynthesis